MKERTLDLIEETEYCTVSSACQLLDCLGFSSMFYTENCETLQSFTEKHGKDESLAADFPGITFESASNKQWYTLTLRHLLADCILESVAVYGTDVTEMSLGVKYAG